MGLLQDIWKKINGSESEPEEELPDDVTRDKYLRSLRREDRVQNEAEEKAYLIKKIAERKKAIARKHLWGFKEKVKERKEEEQSFLDKHNL